MVWFIAGLVLFLFVIYCLLVSASNADDAMEIQTEKLIVPEVTPVPAPTETPELYVRYPVPLDDELQKYIAQKCKEYGIPSSVVIAVIGVESNFDPNRIGDDGHSYGLMQIWETEHHERCVRLGADNLFSPYQNVQVGIDYLAELIDWFDGDWDKALSFYNSDDTGTYAGKVIAYAECLAESVMPFTE